MSGPNELLESVEAPDDQTTMSLNKAINDELADYSNRTKTLWLFLFATEHYNRLELDEFDLSDYQIAAEMVGEE